MSDREIVKILKVQTEGSEQTVKGLREEIKGLQDALLNVEAGTEEYDAVVKKLIDDQTKLNGVMNAGKENGVALEGSYAALQQRLNALQKTWKATNDEGTRNELGKQISEIRGKLSEMDQSTGDWRRNVGNYAQSITQAFGSMGGAASKLVSGPLTSLKAAFTAISAHPIILALVAIIAVIKRLGDAFKTNSEAADTLKRAFSVFQPIIDAVGKAFDWLAGVVAKGIELWAKMETAVLRLIPAYSEAADAAVESARRIQQIEKKETENIEENAKKRRRIAELQANAADKEKYTAKERAQFLTDAFNLEKQITEGELELANLRLQQAEDELKKHPDSDELNKKKAQAVAQVEDTRALLEEKRRSFNKAMSRLRSEDTKDAKDTLLAQLNLEKDFLEQQMGLAEDASDEQLQLAKDKRAKELEIQLAELKDKIKNRKDYEKAELLARKKYEQDILKLETEWARKRQQQRETINDIILMQSGAKGSISYQTELYQRAEEELQEMESAFEGYQKNNSESWKRWGDDNIFQFIKRKQQAKYQMEDYRRELEQAIDKQRLLNQEMELFGLQPPARKALTEHRQVVENLNVAYGNLSEKEKEAAGYRSEVVKYRENDIELNEKNATLLKRQGELEAELAERQASAATGTQKQRKANAEAIKKLNKEIKENSEEITLNEAAIKDNNSALEMESRRVKGAEEEVRALTLAVYALGKQSSDTLANFKKLNGESRRLHESFKNTTRDFSDWYYKSDFSKGFTFNVGNFERANIAEMQEAFEDLEVSIRNAFDPVRSMDFSLLSKNIKYGLEEWQSLGRFIKTTDMNTGEEWVEDTLLTTTKTLLREVGTTDLTNFERNLQEGFARMLKESFEENSEADTNIDEMVDNIMNGILEKSQTLESFFKEVPAEYAELFMGALSEALGEEARNLNANAFIDELNKALTGDKPDIDALREQASQLNLLVRAGILPEEVLQAYITALETIKNKEKEIFQQRFQNWSDLAGHINSITESTADMWEESLRKQKEDSEAAGKYDEKKRKQLEDQYKWIQGLRIATATIDTIQGAIAAYMGYQELGQPWGGILGATAAAAVIASGAAEIQKIANTNPYKQTSLDSSAAYPTVTPYVPQYTANMTGLQETEQLANALGKTNIWVSVKDINSAQKENEVKVAESRF